MMFSIIIPVYKNENSIPRLLSTLTDFNKNIDFELEVVFVVDGSPDQSFALLQNSLDSLKFRAQLLVHSRNFGSFPAIRSGLIASEGDFFGVMAADLQEPISLMSSFAKILEANECDVVVGTRIGRKDPWLSRFSSQMFWGMYKRFIVPEMPAGGVDVFGGNRKFKDQLVALEEARSSLIALIFWLGFRRKTVNYERLERLEGKSSWTLSKKIDYFFDSVFAFTDYPIRFLLRLGAIGSCLSIVFGIGVFLAHFFGRIQVPGYAALMIVILFFGMINILALGLVGTYAWRGYENTKRRPLAIVASKSTNRASIK